MKSTFKLFVFLLFVQLSVLSQEGKVIGVKDGDTVVILDDDKNQYTVRVADIDCPEKNQPFGKKAKWFTSEQIFGKKVSIQVKDSNKPTDRWGRIIGYLIYEDKNLSHELLKAGLAWHYKYYSSDKVMASLESTAKKQKIGLWSDPNPINPYNWRKGERN
ncbi:thermonuclease family protein [Aquimarina mytili]|uniref:Thermonuclease family protein n=1 Tax=Aquimarina mytili TaxID=874423 RepID=A0A937DCW8_9FLAO|nr:thermonuclease family protein [Aquimarina mytili]MBL0686083.1 thermonuclease family protein [Aquimarina mytili]